MGGLVFYLSFFIYPCAMNRDEARFPTLPSQHPAGFKRFFPRTPPGIAHLAIGGIGFRELMPPCTVERPRGTGDFLIMLFHDPAFADLRPNATFHEGPDTLMVWPPGAGQYYGNPAREFSHSWIHCEGARVKKILRDCAFPARCPFRLQNSSRFLKALLDIHSELVTFVSPDFTICGNILENALREIARQKRGETSGSRIPENLLSVHRLIASAPSRPIDLAELARVAGMSPPHFCARFKKSFGLSPVESLIQHRMIRAAHLLADHNLSVAEIAEKVGYTDPFHFSKMFKKQFGISPRSARNAKPDSNRARP